ncbi:MAG: hypothetical protein ACYDCK_15190 [Thermoplasmatota archaeon]
MPDERALPPRATAVAGLVGNGLVAAALAAVGALDRLPELVPRTLALGLATFFASRAVWRLVARASGTMAAAAYVKSAGAAVLIFTATAVLVAPLPLAGPPFALLALACGAHTASRSAEGRAPRGASLALGLALLAASAYTAQPLTDALPDPWRVWTVAALASVAALAPRAAHRVPVPVRRFVANEARAVGLVAPLAVYALFRPFLADAIEHFELYEWTLGLAVAGFVVSAGLAAWKERAVPFATRSGAHVAAPSIKPVPGAELGTLAATFRSWVEEGRGRGAYVAAWKLRGLPNEPPPVDADRPAREANHRGALSRFLDAKRRAIERR